MSHDHSALIAQFREALTQQRYNPVAVTFLTTENRHQALVDEMVVQADRLLKEYEPAIREKVRERKSWLWKKLSLAACRTYPTKII
jgi:hypothetical protein